MFGGDNTERQTDRRIISLFCIILILTGTVIVELLKITINRDYVKAAYTQSTYSVTVETTRGRIYDSKMRPLAGGKLEYRAVIEPSPETAQRLLKLLEPEEYEKISDRLTQRSPFVYSAKDASIKGAGVRVFRGEKRYGGNSAAEHTVGYLDSEGNGASGIEYAYNDCLREYSGSIIAAYTVNSSGRSLSKEEPIITDTSSKSSGGVVLSLDYDIQRIAEEAADEYLERGAVVIVEQPSGKIRASVSRPGFNQDNIGASLESDSAPLINRALTAYDVGSVFKIVVAAAGLENGFDPEWSCECDGSIQIGDNVFHCSNRSGHGELNMCDAVAGSCNIYFIKLARQLGGDVILDYAERLGFGEEILLAENYSAQAGCLPNRKDTQAPAALANLSFGQGRLMATPMQIARLITAVANGGVMPQLSICEGEITPDGKLIAWQTASQPERVMSEQTAQLLTQFMVKTVESGTGRKGASKRTTSAAKTGTAQTGIIRDGHKVLQAWYAGFFPAEEPRYVCIVLVEDGESGGLSAGPVFAYIADRLG